MGINKKTKSVFPTSGVVYTPVGGTVKAPYELVQGEIGIIDDHSNRVVSLESIGATSKIRLGVGVTAPNTSFLSSMVFSPRDITKLGIKEPADKDGAPDVIEFGYDGQDVETGFKFYPGQTYYASIQFDASFAGWLGIGKDSVVTVPYTVPMSADPCTTGDPCSPIDCEEHTRKFVEAIRGKTLPNGRTLGELIALSTTGSCEDVTGTVAYAPLKYTCPGNYDADFWMAQFDSSLRSLGQNVFNANTVKYIGQDGGNHIFEQSALGMVAPTALTIPFFTPDIQTISDSTAPTELYFYTLRADDGNTDLSATVLALDPAVQSVTKASGSTGDIGTYYVYATSDIDWGAIQNVDGFTLTYGGDNITPLVVAPASIAVVPAQAASDVSYPVFRYTLITPGTDVLAVQPLIDAAYPTTMYGAATGVAGTDSIVWTMSVRGDAYGVEEDGVYNGINTPVVPPPFKFDKEEYTWILEEQVGGTDPCACGMKVISKKYAIDYGTCVKYDISYSRGYVHIRDMTIGSQSPIEMGYLSQYPNETTGYPARWVQYGKPVVALGQRFLPAVAGTFHVMLASDYAPQSITQERLLELDYGIDPKEQYTTITITFANEVGYIGHSTLRTENACTYLCNVKMASTLKAFFKDLAGLGDRIEVSEVSYN